MALTKIKFPVLKSLRIQDYQLFPGKDKKGIAHDFLPGITVIAGINGLGKTTLLNIMLRCLTGTREPKKFNPYNPISGVHTMRSKRVKYFAQRVLDEAVDATVDAEFYFGQDIIRIKRSLKNLEILGLWKNKRKVDGDQGALRKAIYRFSGAGDEYDFFYVVRSFTFFLEDKVSLIWNPEGQFEIFRILFFGPKEARELAKLADEIKQIDSDYRNRRVQLNKDRKHLENVKTAVNNLSSLEIKLREEQLAADAKKAILDEHLEELQESLARRDALTEKYQKLHLEIEEMTRQYQSQVETYFTSAMPTLVETTQLILSNLSSSSGCLVCNNSDPKYPQKYLDSAKKGCCPFCGDDTTKKEEHSLDSPANDQIDDVESKLQVLKKSLNRLEHELKTIESELTDLYKTRSELSSEHLQHKNAAQTIRSKLPPSEEERDKEMAEINRKQTEMDALRADREAKTKEYKQMLAAASQTMEKMKERLTERFSYYAGEFLAEQCTLNWKPAKRSLGQEGEKLSFPQFTVEMTSALSQATGSPRNDEEQVSESQKEFIDLAFRMALFDAVRDDGERAMLVIETPEASLDAVFVDQAGRLLRKFATEDKNTHNVVIATTNLNRENMLRSLLGLDEHGNAKGKQETSERVINLLENAAPNAAMRKYKKEYEKSFKDAMKPRK